MEHITHSIEPDTSEVNPLVRVAVFIPKSLDVAVEVDAARRQITKRRLVEIALCAFLGQSDIPTA